MAVDKKNILSRYFLVTVAMAVMGVIIIAKAGYIMFAEKDYWLALAERFVKENVPVEATRGNIFSADGNLMASSLPKYYIRMDFVAGGVKKDTAMMNHLNEICEGLHQILPDKSASYFKGRFIEGRRKGSRSYLLYPAPITYVQYKKVKRLPVLNKGQNASGLHADEIKNRVKPFGSLATRTLGDVYRDRTMGAKNGMELAFDTLLKGREGLTRRQKVKNKYIDITTLPTVDGYDLVTTLDVGMQDICEKALVDKMTEIGATEGVVVLMEVATGDVKAIVNMTKGSNGRYSEVRNGAISNMIEPGSTFKTASIMVALEDGLISPNDVVDTGNGVKMMYGRPMRDHNWRRGGYQTIDVARIMMVSSNIGVSSLIDQHYAKNPGKFVDGLYRLGLNEPLNLQIPGEGKPNIRHPKDGNWYKTALPWMSIGYETQIPPINMLAFYNAIANNGTMVKPRFVKSAQCNGEVVQEFPTEVIKPSICSQKTLTAIQTMLEKVVSEGLGTQAGSKQFPVAGKTGTAQISKGASGYKDGQMNYLVSFCGYFPADEPQYSCIVSIQKPGLPASGGQMAGSVFGKIAERVYARKLALDITAAIDSTSVTIPDVKPGELLAALHVLDELDIDHKAGFRSRNVKEVWGKPQMTEKGVVLENRSVDPKTVPNVVGMGAKDAVYLLESHGLRVNISGVGKVKRQSIPQGTAVKQGQSITLQLS